MANEAAVNSATDTTGATEDGSTDTTEASLGHDPQALRKIVNRLRRAHGQLGAVIKSVENESSCREVVQQLSAVSKALDRAGFLVVATALKECVTDQSAEGEEQTAEIEKLFLTLA